MDNATQVQIRHTYILTDGREVEAERLMTIEEAEECNRKAREYTDNTWYLARKQQGQTIA